MYAIYGYNACKIMKYKDGLQWMGQEPYALLDENAVKQARAMFKQYNQADISISAEKLIARLRFDGVEGIKLYH